MRFHEARTVAPLPPWRGCLCFVKTGQAGAVFGSVERCSYPAGLLGCRTCDGPGPHRAATCVRTGERLIRSRTRQAPLILTLLTALFVAVSLASVRTASADPSISAKRAEAQSVLAQIQEIDGQLSHAIESYNLANVKLDRIKGELRTNSHHLAIARTSLKAAQAHLSDRLVALYKGGGSGGTLEVILARQVDGRPAQPNRCGRSRLRAGRARAPGGQELPHAGDREQAPARARSEGTGSGRRRQGRAAQLDRGPARRASASALLDQGSDRQPRGRRAAPSGAARRAGAGALPRHAAAVRR